MTSNFLYLSFSTLYSSSLWRTDTIVFAKLNTPPVPRKPTPNVFEIIPPPPPLQKRIYGILAECPTSACRVAFYLNANLWNIKCRYFFFCRQTLQTKRDNVTKEVNEFKSDYGRYMATMSKKVTEGKAEHARLTEYVSGKSKSLL